MTAQTKTVRSLLTAALLGCLAACAETSKPPTPTPTPTPAAPNPISGPALSWTDLPTRKATPGPRFATIDPKAAGLDFVHAFEAPKGREAEFAGPFAGGGVALGDYDGDGKVDVCLTRQTGGAKLYRNRGDFKFEDVTAKVGIVANGWTTAPSFVDLDGDGDLDLLIGQFDAPLLVFINQNGTFQESGAALGLNIKAATTGLAFADYDRDGDLDLYLVTYRRTPTGELKGNSVLENGIPMPPKAHREYLALMNKPGQGVVVVNAGQPDRLLRNDGGTFVDVTEKAGIGTHYEMGLSARFWDYDGDGWQDLYVANDFFGADRLYRNQRGTFVEVTEAALPHTPWFSMGADAGDIDNDGRLDFFAADMAGTNHFKQKLSMGDMDDDGWFLETATPRQYMRNAVYLNTGTDRFMEIAKLTGLASTDWTWTPRFVDLDLDGKLDLFASNGMTRDYSDSDVRMRLKLKDRWQSFDIGYWLKQPPRAEPNLAYKNLGELSFQSVGDDWGLGGNSVSFGMAVGDLDADGDPDLVVNDFEAPPRLYRNETTGQNAISLRLIARGNPWAIGARIEARAGDNIFVRDIALSGGFMAANDPIALIGLGSVTTLDALTITWPDGTVQTHTQDLAANRRYTVRQHESKPMGKPEAPARLLRAIEPIKLTARQRKLLSDALGQPDTQQTAQLRHVDAPFDDFRIQPLLPNKVSALGPGLAFTHDAHQFLSGGNGGFGTVNSEPMPGRMAADEQGAIFFDVDSDGDLDLYVAAGGVEQRPGADVYRNRLYLNDADKAPGARWRLELQPDADSSGHVAAVDYDRDGDVDLFVGGRVVPGAWPTAPNSRIFMNEKGKLVDVTETVAPGLKTAGMVTSAIWTDADNDGAIDLMITYEWGPVRWWRQVDGRFVDQTKAARLDAQTGWFNSITAGDVDNDGDLDYLVGNTGLNTKYHPSVEKPAIVWYGAFGADGSRHIVEGKYEKDILYPVRGRSCSSDAMPELAKKYGTFTAFAKSTAEDIYGEKLAQAQRFEVDTLESGVLINDGAGHFGFRPLPRWAQASPIFGSGFLDLNHDGNLDIVAAQNFYGPQRETGRFDGGVGAVLLGDGKGGFAPISPADSGLVVAGDATALTLAYLNDDACADVAIATHNGPVHVFEQPCRAPEYRVKLQGKPGDPGGFGARVTLTLKDGRTRVAEVHAGSGYLGQNQVGEVFGFAQVSDVKSVHVRWADGTETSVPATPGGVTVKR